MSFDVDASPCPGTMGATLWRSQGVLWRVGGITPKPLDSGLSVAPRMTAICGMDA